MIRRKPFIFSLMLLGVLAIYHLTGENVYVFCALCLLEKHKVPSPENIRIDAENQVYVLQWDYARENTTFRAQWSQ